MADVKISELTDGGDVREDDVLAAVRAGQSDTIKVSMTALGGGVDVVRVNVTADTTYHLADVWDDWAGNIVLFRAGAGAKPTVTIDGEKSGTAFAPSAKGQVIRLHPLWRGGRIEFKNLAWARHDSDGRVSEHSKSTTARNATQGLGEPFHLIHDDYYVGSTLYGWHVAPLTQDVAAVLADAGETLASLTEIEALERRLDKIVEHNLSELSQSYWPQVPYDSSIAGNSWLKRHTYNMTIWNPAAEVQANGYRVRVARGSFKLEFEAIWNDGSSEVYDGKTMLANAGVNPADVTNSEIAVYVRPTKNGNAVTGAQLACLMDADTGRLKAPAPFDQTFTLTDAQAQSALELNWIEQDGRSLNNANHLADATATAPIAVDTLRLYGTAADITAIRDLLEPGGSVVEGSRVLLEDDAGSIDVYRVSGFGATAAVGADVWNAALRHADLTIDVNTVIYPQLAQSLHFAVDETEDDGADSTRQFELVRAGSGDVDVTTANQFVATGIDRPTTDLIALTVGSINAGDYDQQALIFIEKSDLDSLTVAAAGAAATSANSIIVAENNNDLYRMGRTADGEILITTDATGTDLLPLVVYAVHGLDVAEVGSNNTRWSAASRLTSTTLTLPSTDIFAIKLGRPSNSAPFNGGRLAALIFILKSDIDSIDHAVAGATAGSANSIRIAEINGTVYVAGVTSADELLIGSSVAAHDANPVALHSVSGIDIRSTASRTVDVTQSDRFVATQIAKPSTDVFAVTLGKRQAAEAPRKNLIMIREEEFDSLAVSSAGQQARSAATRNAIQIDNHGNSYDRLGKDATGDLLFTSASTSAGDADPFQVFTVDTHEAEGASGGLTGQSGGGSGAYSSVRVQNLSQVIPGDQTTIRLGGQQGYALDDTATHFHVDIEAPTNLSGTTQLYYVDPDDEISRSLYDEDGDTIHLTAGATISHRFGRPFMKRIDGKYRLRLMLISSPARTGADLEITLTHETDANSALVEPFQLLGTETDVPIQTLVANLATNTLTEIEFDNWIEMDRIEVMVVRLETLRDVVNESAQAELVLTGAQIQYMDELSATGLQNRTSRDNAINGWMSLGWLNVGLNTLDAWRRKPVSGYVTYYRDRYPALPGRIIGLNKDGLYLRGLRAISWGGASTKIRRVTCLRRV